MIRHKYSKELYTRRPGGEMPSIVVAESGIGVRFKRIAVPDAYSHFVGSQQFIREKLGIKSFDITSFLAIGNQKVMPARS